jgi:hypothetical protein
MGLQAPLVELVHKGHKVPQERKVFLDHLQLLVLLSGHLLVQIVLPLVRVEVVHFIRIVLVRVVVVSFMNKTRVLIVELFQVDMLILTTVLGTVVLLRAVVRPQAQVLVPQMQD